MEVKQVKLPRSEIIEILTDRYGYECFLCHKEFRDESEITIDHWYPQSKGGTWDISNLRLMDKRCNAIKGDRIPNEDGTLPPLRRETGLGNRRAIRRGDRPELCGKCNNGRLLGPQESCNVCGSGPMPERYPRWAKVRASECDHAEWWCFLCASGIVDRKPTINYLIEGPSS